MALPPITNLNPEIQPAVDERNYDKMYMTLLVSRFNQNTQKQTIKLNFRQYDSAANVVKDNDAGGVQVDINDVFAKAAEVPAFAEAMGAVTIVANLFCEEKQLQTQLQELQSVPEEEQDEEAIAAKQAEIEALQTKMTTKTLAEIIAG